MCILFCRKFGNGGGEKYLQVHRFSAYVTVLDSSPFSSTVMGCTAKTKSRCLETTKITGKEKATLVMSFFSEKVDI